MKTLKILAFLVVVFTFNACDEVEDVKNIADISVDRTILDETEIPIPAGSHTFSIEDVLSADTPETHEYLDRIKSVTITKMTYQFIDFIGSDDCRMNITFLADENVFDTQENVLIKESFDNNTVYEITDKDDLKAMSDALLNNGGVNFKIEGDSEASSDSSFKIKTVIDLTITATPL